MTNSKQLTINCVLSAESLQALSDGIWVTFEIQPNQDIKILTWLTPLEGLLSDLFVVTDDIGNELIYQGPMIKRGAPSDSDYLMINANDRKINKVDLALVYSFEPGKKYHIGIKELVLNIIDNNQNQQYSKCTNKNGVEISVLVNEN